jgi:hypothetical protein
MMLLRLFEFSPIGYNLFSRAMRPPAEPLFPRVAPRDDEDDDEERAADARARTARARSSSGAGPRESSSVLDATRLLVSVLSPRSLALGVVAASLLVYICASLLDPSPVRVVLF